MMVHFGPLRSLKDIWGSAPVQNDPSTPGNADAARLDRQKGQLS